MQNFKTQKNTIKNDEDFEMQEDEIIPIYKFNNSKFSKKNETSNNFFYHLLIIFILIIILLIIFNIIIYLKRKQTITTVKNRRQINEYINNTTYNTNNLTEIEHSIKLIKINETKENKSTAKTILQEINRIAQNLTNSKNEKIGLAFVFKSLFGNGIGRALSLLCSGLAKLEIYDIYI